MLTGRLARNGLAGKKLELHKNAEETLAGH